MSWETASCLAECREYGEKLLETMKKDQEEIQRCLGEDLMRMYQELTEEEKRLAEELVRNMKKMQSRNV